MKRGIFILGLVLLIVLNGHSQFMQTITSSDGRFLRNKMDAPLLGQAQLKNSVSIDTVYFNDQIQFQQIEGFGYTLTGGSAYLLHQMPVQNRLAILKELFGKGPNDLNVNYLRISIGASDLDATVFSYDDLPVGEVDPDLIKMTIAKDQEFLIPILKEIQSIQPNLKLISKLLLIFCGITLQLNEKIIAFPSVFG